MFVQASTFGGGGGGSSFNPQGSAPTIFGAGVNPQTATSPFSGAGPGTFGNSNNLSSFRAGAVPTPFSQSSPNSNGSSAFGNNNFGANNVVGGFGNSNQAPLLTTNSYAPLREPQNTKNGPPEQLIYVDITAQQQFKGHSMEELRLNDVRAKNNPGAPGLTGATSGMPFGSSNVFGQTNQQQPQQQQQPQTAGIFGGNVPSGGAPFFSGSSFGAPQQQQQQQQQQLQQQQLQQQQPQNQFQATTFGQSPAVFGQNAQPGSSIFSGAAPQQQTQQQQTQLLMPNQIGAAQPSPFGSSTAQTFSFGAGNTMGSQAAQRSVLPASPTVTKNLAGQQFSLFNSSTPTSSTNNTAPSFAFGTQAPSANTSSPFTFNPAATSSKPGATLPFNLSPSNTSSTFNTQQPNTLSFSTTPNTQQPAPAAPEQVVHRRSNMDWLEEQDKLRNESRAGSSSDVTTMTLLSSSDRPHTRSAVSSLLPSSSGLRSMSSEALSAGGYYGQLARTTASRVRPRMTGSTSASRSGQNIEQRVTSSGSTRLSSRKPLVITPRKPLLPVSEPSAIESSESPRPSRSVGDLQLKNSAVNYVAEDKAALVESQPELGHKVNPHAPVLTNTYYKTTPSTDELGRMTYDQLKSVEEFVVTKYNVDGEKAGSITWQHVDVTDVDLKHVKIVNEKDSDGKSHLKVTVYQDIDDPNARPRIGSKLNKESVITFFDVESKRKNYEEKMREKIERGDGTFLSFKDKTLVWKVPHWG